MWTYLGAGVMPEVPGVPARDLTDAEHASAVQRLGAAALRGVYVQAETETHDFPELTDAE